MSQLQELQLIKNALTAFFSKINQLDYHVINRFNKAQNNITGTSSPVKDININDVIKYFNWLDIWWSNISTEFEKLQKEKRK